METEKERRGEEEDPSLSQQLQANVSKGCINLLFHVLVQGWLICEAS